GQVAAANQNVVLQFSGIYEPIFLCARVQFPLEGLWFTFIPKVETTNLLAGFPWQTASAQSLKTSLGFHKFATMVLRYAQVEKPESILGVSRVLEDARKVAFKLFPIDGAPILVQEPLDNQFNAAQKQLVLEFLASRSDNLEAL